jgi:hypothetical protein
MALEYKIVAYENNNMIAMHFLEINRVLLPPSILPMKIPSMEEPIPEQVMLGPNSIEVCPSPKPM